MTMNDFKVLLVFKTVLSDYKVIFTTIKERRVAILNPVNQLIIRKMLKLIMVL